jgi:hypothetical protein
MLNVATETADFYCLFMAFVTCIMAGAINSIILDIKTTTE